MTAVGTVGRPGKDVELHIANFPTFLLQEVFDFLLPGPIRVDAPSDQWLPIIRLLSTARGLAADAVGDGLQEDMPHLDPSVSGKCSSWTSLLAALRHCGSATWHPLRPLRALRVKSKFSSPLQVAPQISGSSLCFLERGKIALFGGRCSVSGDTLGTSYVVQIPSQSSTVVQWEELHCEYGPAARCYHAAFPGIRGPTMVIFGGAGKASIDSASLLRDTWLLEVNTVLANQLGATASHGMWKKLDGGGDSKGPCGRSTHICSPWKSQKLCAVLHGGLGECGVLSDCWLLQPTGQWVQLQTSGPRIARAHHCGGVVQDALLVYSGQDERYLTVKGCFLLQLLTAVWEEVTFQNGPSPRIDAACATVETVGVLVFGGVGMEFEFEADSPWMLPVGKRADLQPRRTACVGEAPCPRTCSSMCSDGFCAYIFGGFDGERDLGDLWCLNLAPNCFEGKSRQYILSLLPQVRGQSHQVRRAADFADSISNEFH